MLAVISPAKTLDFESPTPPHESTTPEFTDDAASLISVLRKMTRPQLQELMKLSENLADLNHRRYREWSLPFTEDNARAALFAFKGDVYTGFHLDDYEPEDLRYAQRHLRILSGLYGVLRPLDLIQPYRLEMGTSLQTERGKNLYEFWGDRLAGAVDRDIRESGRQCLINLASNEYSSAVPPSGLDAEIVTPQFKDLKKGAYKVVAFYAKRARGMMCDFMIRHRLDDPEDLKGFDGGGYRFNPEESEGNRWVFTRDEVPAT